MTTERREDLPSESARERHLARLARERAEDVRANGVEEAREGEQAFVADAHGRAAAGGAHKGADAREEGLQRGVRAARAARAAARAAPRRAQPQQRER